MLRKNKYEMDWEEYARLARQSVSEGVVLLENKDTALPLRKGEKISVFGRIQFDYYKSGTGSGGLVNTKYVVSILDALLNEKTISINENLIKVYQEWIKENPFDQGAGWGQEPWAQNEMPLTDEIMKEAVKDSDRAIVVIGRTAGEDRDNANEKGSYLLTDREEEMLLKVSKSFSKVIVILNVGNIIDMKWVKKYQPSAVLYAWQGGMEGGNGVVDVLMGRVNPSGKLSDTIAYSIEDYPSTRNFGADYYNFYAEDIYVGYRYFETFVKEKVLYPFGYGLSYTEFEINCIGFKKKENQIIIMVSVTNVGIVEGKEVVQVYLNPPQGKLGKPVRNLVAYEKTKKLEPDEKQEITFTIDEDCLASYDDGGITGFKACYVMEAGVYKFYVGNSVRAAKEIGEFELSKLFVQQKCTQALSPVKEFKRMKALSNNKEVILTWEDTPVRTYDLQERMQEDSIHEIAYTGNRGIKLGDVYDNRNYMDEFVAQLLDEELCCMVRGEGMCSSKVTPGTAAAFGGLSKALLDYGIPAACCADGPSGIRMDCGTYAFSLPNGTLLACSFNVKLVEQLFRMLGLELRKNRIDTILGPGMNIHRNPLNGRNFEYFSEDPYLTGTIAVSQLKGMEKYGVTGTIKHFAANNQEHNRRLFDSVVSERALREIYLKGFEIAVKEGYAYSVMTTYGAINGIYTASNYDLLTVILRREWKYNGMVMTDWWAEMNEEGVKPSMQNTAAMVRCQNDIFMVVEDAKQNSNQDNLYEELKNGKLQKAALQRCAVHICKALLKFPCMDRGLGRLSKEEREAELSQGSQDEIDFAMKYYEVNQRLILDTKDLNTQKGSTIMYGLSFTIYGIYTLRMRIKADAKDLAQIPVSLFMNGSLIDTISVNGANKEWLEYEKEMGPFFTSNNYFKLFFAQSGMKIDGITIELKKEQIRPSI